MNPNNPIHKQYHQQRILIALSDGQWHRNKELKDKTKLTPRTLSKHLNELEKELHWIERREDTESGEYPHPVLYKATHSIASCGRYIKTIIDNADEIETDLTETKDPLQLLKEFHEINLYYFTLILEKIQESKSKNLKELDSIMKFVYYSPYEIYTKQIITAFTKAVQFGERFDINQLRQKHSIWNGINEQQITEKKNNP